MESGDHAYKAEDNFLRILALTTEFDFAKAPNVLNHSQLSHDEALNSATKFTHIIKDGDAKVIRKDVSGSLTFDEVHNMDFPRELFTCPVTILFYYLENTSKCFCHIRSDLSRYDGLSCLHTAFCILEYLEHSDNGIVSPESYMTSAARFKGHNPKPLMSHQIIGFIRHGLVLLYYGVIGLFLKYVCRSSWVPLGPMMASYEFKVKPRVWKRWSDVKLPFREVLAVLTALKTSLQLPEISYTVNYAPFIALGYVRSFEDTKDVKKRVANISVPLGPPLLMNDFHTIMISTSIFYNNYGRFDPNISGEVKDFVWNWVGVCDAFQALVIAITIKNKLFIGVSLPEPSSKHFAVVDVLGEGHVHPAIPKIR